MSKLISDWARRRDAKTRSLLVLSARAALGLARAFAAMRPSPKLRRVK